MSNLSPPPVNARPPEDIDGVLRAFFQAEMPHPWPALTLPARPVTPQRSRTAAWLRDHGRLALAASVAFLLISYWTLAGLFPDAGAPNLGADPGRQIGKDPRPKNLQPVVPTPKKVETKHGAEALMWEDLQPGKLIRLDLLETTPPRKQR